jgi:photosystem II stability/assembly factor-like uncharacterized protein
MNARTERLPQKKSLLHLGRMAGFMLLVCVVLASMAAQLNPSERLKLKAARSEDFLGGGPPGGDVCNVVVDPHSSETLYATVSGGGIFKSVNGGITWEVRSRGLPADTGCDIALDPHQPNTLYVEALGRLYKTVDGGSHWNLTDSGLPEAGLPAIDPSKSQTLYTKTRKGLFKSINGGKSWTEVNSSDLPQMNEGLGSSTLVVDGANPAILYDGTSIGIFKSHDAGRTWIKINSRLADPPEITALAIDPNATTTLYASTLANASVFKSTNSGESWQPSNSGLEKKTDDVITEFLVNPLNSDIVYALSSTGIFKSVDAGKNWQRATSGMENTLFWAIAMEPSDPSILYAATWRGIFKSTDAGATWNTANVGISRHTIFDLVVLDSAGKLVLARSNYGLLFESIDGGDHWSLVQGLPVGKVESLEITFKERPMLFAEVNGRIYESEDTARTWLPVDLSSSTAEEPLPQVGLASPATICVTIKNKLLCSLNGGDSWRLYSPQIPGVAITGVWIDPFNGQNLFAGTFYRGLYRSTDLGRTWKRVGDLPGIRYSLSFDPNNPNTIYLRSLAVYVDSSEGDMYKSVDAGNSWMPIRIDSRNIPVDFLGVTGNPTVLFAGVWRHTDPDTFELLKSTNGGVNWTKSTSGIPPSRVETLISSPQNPSILFVGTDERGVFKSTDGGKSWKPTASK